MVDKQSSPAFSMGHSNRTTINHLSQAPGPGAYEVAHLHPHRVTSRQITMKERFQGYETLTPGPGTYSNVGMKGHSPSAIIISRSANKILDTHPSPNSYHPDYTKLIKKDNGYKIGSSERIPVSEDRKLPGPGAYEPNQIHDKSGLKFGKEKRIDLASKTINLGPGEYSTTVHNADLLQSRSPVVTFGKSSRSMSSSTLSPGPASYTVPDKLTQSISKKQGFSISFKQRSISHQNGLIIPGPGAYNLDEVDKIKHKSVNCSIGKAPRLKIESQGKDPSPQFYSVNYTSLKDHGQLIGKGPRLQLGAANFVPGPGAYDAKLNSNLPKFSIPKSHETVHPVFENPGPCTYNAKPINNGEYTQIVFKKDERRPFYDEKKGIPGPGHYDSAKVVYPSNGYKIGNQRRNTEKAASHPGPGMYNIPSTISNIPQYAK